MKSAQGGEGGGRAQRRVERTECAAENRGAVALEKLREEKGEEETRGHVRCFICYGESMRVCVCFSERKNQWMEGVGNSFLHAFHFA